MSGLCVSDWMRLNCGDTVCAIDDPRHHGRLEAIHNSATVKVKWEGTGWISYLPMQDIRKVDERLDRIGDLDAVTTQVHSLEDARRLVALLKRHAKVSAVAMPIDAGYRVVLIDEAVS